MSKLVVTVFLCSLLIAPAAALAGPDDILGVWLNGLKNTKIEISKCGEKYCGKIVWLKEPGSDDGIEVPPKFDIHNPSVPLMGLQIVHDFTYAGDNVWKGAKLYDPRSGNTYRGKMNLVSPNRLELRGYIGIPLLGRTEVWTR